MLFQRETDKEQGNSSPSNQGKMDFGPIPNPSFAAPVLMWTGCDIYSSVTKGAFAPSGSETTGVNHPTQFYSTCSNSRLESGFAPLCLLPRLCFLQPPQAGTNPPLELRPGRRLTISTPKVRIKLAVVTSPLPTTTGTPSVPPLLLHSG